MVRRVVQLIVALLMAAIPCMLVAAPARADDLSDFLGQVNALRLLHGLSPLTTDPTLTSLAQTWSEHMASTGVLLDDPNLASEVSGGWAQLGENTAYGSSFDLLFNALLNSAPHLANMLGPYSLTGVAEVVTSGGLTWLTEVFEEPRASTPTPVAAAPPVARAPVVRVVAPAPSPVASTVPAPRPVITAPPTTAAPATTSTTVVAPPASAPTTATAAGAAPPATAAQTASAGATPADVALSAHDTPESPVSYWVLALSMVAIISIAGAGGLVVGVRKRH